MQPHEKPQSFTVGGITLYYADLAAIAVFVFASVFFIVNARYGGNESDETLYQVVCYRLSRGDKLFADDWMFITNAYFLYIPYRLATFFMGGTEGIILALRYFNVAVKMAFFVYIYISLRKYRLWAALAASLYIGTDLFGMKSMDFYSICMNAALVTAVTLFVRENARPRQYIFAGFVFSCSVVVQPGTALVWAAYCALVLMRYIAVKKGRPLFAAYDFVLAPRVWRYLLFGVLAAAGVFFIVSAAFFTGTDLKAIALGFGELTKLLGRRTAAGYSFAYIRLNKPVMYAIMYQPALFIAFFVLLALSLTLPKKLPRFEKPLLLALLALFIALSVHLILYPVETPGNTVGEAACHGLLTAVMGLPFYALSKHKNRRLFAFLLFSFALSLTVDAFSNNTFGSVLLLGDIPAVLLLRGYLSEQKSPAAPATKKRAAQKTGAPRPYAAALCAFVAFLAVFEGVHWGYMTTLPKLEAHLSGSFQPLDTVVDAGAYKGVITTRELADFCEKTARDSQTIASMGREGLYVADYDVTAYLGSGADVCAPWAQVFQNWEGEETWWRTHRFPEVVYIPYSALSYAEDVSPVEERLSYFLGRGDFSVEEGAAGYILTLNALFPEE